MNQKDCIQVNQQKVAIIGCGFVGAACAFALMQSGMFSEMVLIDVDKSRAEGEAMDISHGVPFAKPSKIYAGDYDDISDAEQKMATNQIRRIPVVDNNKVIGILTLGDLAQYSDEIGEEYFCDTVEDICGCGGKAKNNY